MHLGNRMTDHLGQTDQFLPGPLLPQPGVDVLLGRDARGDVLHHDGVGHVVTEEHGGGRHSNLFTFQQGSRLGFVSVFGQLSVKSGMPRNNY